MVVIRDTYSNYNTIAKQAFISTMNSRELPPRSLKVRFFAFLKPKLKNK